MVSTETSGLWSATIGSVGIGLALTGIHLAHRELKSLALEPEKAEFKRVQDRAFSVRTGLEEELFRAQDFADLLSSRAPLPQSRTSRLTQVYLDIDECNRTIIKAEEYLHSTLLWWSADFVEERNNARMKIENLNEAIDAVVDQIRDDLSTAGAI